MFILPCRFELSFGSECYELAPPGMLHYRSACELYQLHERCALGECGTLSHTSE